MILVTGATGFVGSHLLLHLLENNWPVRALHRGADSINQTKQLFALYGKLSLFDKIEWILADITDIPSLAPVFNNVEKVYHCAALISFDPADEEILRKINIEGTANIVNYCLAFGVKKICHVSSIAALGDPKENEKVIDENIEWNPEKPHSDYAISKYGAEMEIWRGLQEGLEVVIVNPGVILGPGFWNSGSGEIYNKVANGLAFYTKGTTGITTVVDVAAVMVRLMESEISGERFTIVSENHSFETLLKLIANAINVKPPTIRAKRWMTSVAWRLDWLLSLFGKKRTISRSMADSLHNNHYYSNDKIKSVLEYSFQDLANYINTLGAFYIKR